MDEWDCHHPALTSLYEAPFHEQVITCSVCHRTVRLPNRMIWQDGPSKAIRRFHGALGEAFGREWAVKLMPLEPVDKPRTAV
jgi:hypothetical protein